MLTSSIVLRSSFRFFASAAARSLDAYRRMCTERTRIRNCGTDIFAIFAKVTHSARSARALCDF